MAAARSWRTSDADQTSPSRALQPRAGCPWSFIGPRPTIARRNASHGPPMSPRWARRAGLICQGVKLISSRLYSHDFASISRSWGDSSDRHRPSDTCVSAWSLRPDLDLAVALDRIGQGRACRPESVADVTSHRSPERGQGIIFRGADKLLEWGTESAIQQSRGLFAKSLQRGRRDIRLIERCLKLLTKAWM